MVLHLLPCLYASLCHGEWASPADLLTLSPLRSLLLHLPPHSLALQPRRGAEAPSFSVPAVIAKRRQGSRHHSYSHSEQELPVVSETDFYPSARHNLKTPVCSAKEPLTVCYKPGLDYQINVDHQPASKKNAPPCQSVIKDSYNFKSDHSCHSVSISTPVSQPAPAPRAAWALPSLVPGPAPRARAAETQPVPASVPVPQVGTAKARPILPPVMVPRDRRPSPQLELQPQHPEPAECSALPQPEVPAPAGPALSPPESYAKPRRQ